MESYNVDIGLEAFVDTADLEPAESFGTYEMLELAEEAVMLEIAAAQLDKQLSFLGTTGSIAAYAQSEGANISGGLETLFSTSCMAIAGMYDANNAAATGKALEAGLEGYWEKAVNTVNTILEKIRTFLSRVIRSKAALRAKLVKAEVRINGLTKSSWKKENKVIKIPGSVTKEAGLLVLTNAGKILKAAEEDLTKFDGKNLDTAFVSGALLGQLRKSAADMKEVKCVGNAKAAAVKALKDAKNALAMMDEVDGQYKLAKSVKAVARKMKDASGKEALMKPTKAFSMAASVYSWYSVYHMKVIAADLKLIAQVK